MRPDFFRSATAALAITALAACTPPSQAALQHAKASPPSGQVGILASTPPYDNSINPLRCHIDGPATICARDNESSPAAREP
jgi:hypothetical protein